MKKIFEKIGRVSARTWLYLFIISMLLCVLSLRHNNIEMTRLRDAVYTADQNNGDVNTALNNLRKFVYSHMNTNLSSGNGNIKPPVQLKYTYQRLYEAQLARVQAADQRIYSDAQVYCHGHAAPDSAVAQNACIQNYAVNHGVKSAEINIPAGLYQFDFVSPTWSPDLAGWSLVVSSLLLMAFLLRLWLAKIRH